MAPINVTFATATGGATMQAVESSARVSSVAAALAGLLGIPAARMAFLFNDAPLAADATFAAAGVGDNDLVIVEARVPAAAPAALAARAPVRGGISNDAISAMQRQIELLGALRRPDVLARIRAAQPALAAAVEAGDGARAELLYGQLQQSHATGGRLLEGVSGEGGEEERVRIEAVMENFEIAMERNPESFGQVCMLFVEAKINNHPVTAFVDSGAQATILSVDTAKRCGIYRLLDTRFAGMARGVGTAKILGRIHLALLHVGAQVLETTFTVMEDSTYDMLLGLDMLRRHQAAIDLKGNVLRIGDATVEFLPEHKIPRSMRHLPSADADAESAGAGQATGGEPPPADSPAAASAAAAARRAADAAAPAVQAAPASPALPAPAGGGGGGGGDGAKVAALVSLGFSHEDAVQALASCNGNQEQAASLLAQAKYGF
jgi:DNA damage-inducible protein 1